MEAIKKSLDKIAKHERKTENFERFLTTKRGEMFVRYIHKSNLKDLYTRFEVPHNARLESIYSVYTILHKMGKMTRQYKEGGRYVYSLVISCPNQKHAKVKKHKQPRNLTKEELRKIENRRPKKLGLAAKLHLYEEHKMKRYEKRHTFPTERELKQDLFPEEISITTNTSKYLYREYVRNFLSRIYCNVNKKELDYRLFGVYKNKTNSTLFEKEMDPIIVGYSFTTLVSTDAIESKIRSAVQQTKLRDSECLELKLYNKYGKFITSYRCQLVEIRAYYYEMLTSGLFFNEDS